MHNINHYDQCILDIIHNHNTIHGKNDSLGLRLLQAFLLEYIKEGKLKRTDTTGLGERITLLYMHGFIVNKEGYKLTRKGRLALEAVAADDDRMA